MGRNYFECLSPDLSVSSSHDNLCSAPRTGTTDAKEVFRESTEVRRVWEPNDAGLKNGSDVSSVATVMSYNVLAQSYVSSKIFDATHRPFLRARHRRRRLWEELRRLTTLYEVDILCLQELEADEHGRIAAELPEFAEGSYKQRTAVGVRHKRDGSGVYWRKSKFFHVDAVADNGDLVDEHVELNSIAEDPSISPVCDSRNEILRNCVGALVRLQDRNSGAKLVVGSAHLFWDPSFPKLKLAQASLFRRAAFTAAHSFETGNVILAGDWNSMPSSAVYAFMTDSETTRCHEEVQDCGSELLDAILRKSEWDQGRLLSTYRHDLSDTWCLTADTPLTTFTPKFSGSLDHIFVSSTLESGLLGSLSLPSRADFIDAGIDALPNGFHNSDHLPVISRLAL